MQLLKVREYVQKKKGVLNVGQKMKFKAESAQTAKGILYMKNQINLNYTLIKVKFSPTNISVE